jgi:hypothetical protein
MLVAGVPAWERPILFCRAAEFAVAAVRRAGRPFLGRRRAEYCPESDQPMARGMD